MKEEILSIASDLREGSMTTNEARNQLLRLFGVMQAEGSEGVQGAAVASGAGGEANTCVDCGTLPVVIQNGIKRCAYCGTLRA